MDRCWRCRSWSWSASHSASAGSPARSPTGGTTSRRAEDAAERSRPPDRDRERAHDLLGPRDGRVGRASRGGRGRRGLRAGAAALPQRADPGPSCPRLHSPDARRPRPDRARREPAGALRLVDRGAHDARPLAARACRVVDTGANRTARAGARRGRVRRAFGARLDLVRAGGGDHGAVLRGLGGGPRPACCEASRLERRGRRRHLAEPAPARARAARQGRGRDRDRGACSCLGLAVAQPWRADREGDDALKLLEKGDFAGARAAASGRATSTRSRRSRSSSARRSRTQRATDSWPHVRSRTPSGSSPPAPRRGAGSASTTRSTWTILRGLCRPCGPRCTSTRPRHSTAALTWSPCAPAPRPRPSASRPSAKRAAKRARRAAQP